MIRTLSIITALFTLLSCKSIPDGATPVSNFEAQKYLGKWYEIARLDHPFERGLSHITAEYSINEDGTIQVVNRGYKTEAGEWTSAEGKAIFSGPRDVGQLKVSFFGPFYGAYKVIELAPDYSYALVVGPNTSYLWILARQAVLAPTVQKKLIDKAKTLGFDTDSLIYVDHSQPSP